MFMCLARHTNDSSKLLKKSSHTRVKNTVDLPICDWYDDESRVKKTYI